MQMHIKKKGSEKSNLCSDHTLLEHKIERSIKILKWDFILAELPPCSVLVGGYIRDLILGNLNDKPDIDIVVPKDALLVAKRIAQKFDGRFVILDQKRDVGRIVFDNFVIDLATQLNNSIKADLLSRDFSINSISFSFEKNKIFDPSHGIKDISNSILRTYKSENLITDPLRMLRGFRFFSELDFLIDEQFMNFVQANKEKLKLVAVERIQYEFKKIIRGKQAVKTLLILDKLELFDWLESGGGFSNNLLEEINYLNFSNDELAKFRPIFFLVETFNELAIRKLKFSKSEIKETNVIRKWRDKLTQKSIETFNDYERFHLHKDLEKILPAFIFYLPDRFQIEWMNRWRNKEDKLFHPKNFVKGETLKKYIKIDDGPLLGDLIDYLSIEFAYGRLKDFDESIYKAKRWFQQNAPKCD